MPVSEKTGQRIKAWLRRKQSDQIIVQSPFVNVPDLPDLKLVQLKEVPKLTGSVKRLAISSSLGFSVQALASLLSVMDRSDAEKLYTEMSKKTTSLNIDEKLAHSWFTVCHRLHKSKMSFAVTSYFSLAALHELIDFNRDLASSLACLYKALLSSGIQSSSNLDILFRIAEQFPDRFAFVCVRAASGGDRILSALGKSLFAINCLNLSTEESTSILDYTMETGWLLDNRDHEQIWKLIMQRGSRVHEKLTGGLVPMSSIRFFAGILRGIQEKHGLDVLVTREREQKAVALFDIKSQDNIADCFARFPQLAPLIDHQIKMDFTEEVISHRIAEADESDLGYWVVVFLEMLPGGVSISGVMNFLKSNGEEITSEVLAFLEKLIGGTKEGKRPSVRNINGFSAIVSRVLPFSTVQDRTSLKGFYRALIDMDDSQANWAILHLDEATLSGIQTSSILSAASLVLRASNEGNRKEFLSRILLTGRLIDTLSPADRSRALSSLVPPWVDTLLSFEFTTEEKVISFISKIKDINNRNRYLENIVTGLLSELHPDDPVFDDCLDFAVNGYNSSGAIEKLRETEHNVFKKVFRAGGRVELVDGLMVDLLSIPGFEGEKTGEFIAGLRSICDRFSRLAVWDDRGDTIFTDFIGTGVGNILRAFVDNPYALDSVNAETVEKLLELLFLDGSALSKSTRIVNPGGTAQTFFGEILPDSISLFKREPEALPAFLFEIGDEFSRSVGGMTAGEGFAKYLVRGIDLEIQQDCVTVLGSWLSQKTPPPLSISEKWSNQRREEWNTLRVREDTTRMKLYGAVSALAGSSDSNARESVLNTAGYFSKQMERAGIPGAASLSLKWNRKMVDEILALSGDLSLLDRFRDDLTGADVSSELYSYLASIEGFIEENIFHAWRQTAFPPLLNCSIEIALVSGKSPKIAAEMAKAATDAVEFLGYSSADGFLSTLQGCFRDATTPESGFALMEKHFLLPLWKRNSSERLDLLLLGMKESRLLTGILNERLAIETRVDGKVVFMRNFATFFVTVEKAMLEIQSDFEKSKIADGLMDSWIFSGIGSTSGKPLVEISETAELVQDIFRRVKYGSGIVSASEAGQISADMRRKYRDNADSVAIILKWTVDPAREGLLQLLEESQLLLQAAGTDSELMRLLDVHGARRSFLQEAKQYSENPGALKKYLKTLSLSVEE